MAPYFLRLLTFDHMNRRGLQLNRQDEHGHLQGKL
jgi:hypothetical protein